MLSLTPAIKNYPWGRVGTKSLVAQLSSAVESISDDTPYAELWMGSHPSGSCTLENGRTLTEYISDNPEVLGKEVCQKFGSKLPFLFKVLSVETALSIQAHPDKTLAGILHLRDPKNYPDDNHKPEMAIAVTPFEVLCGFRSLPEIQHFIQTVPEICAIIGNPGLDSKKDLQEAFTKLMKCHSVEVASQVSKLLDRGDAVPESELIHRLNRQFPGDVGIFAVFFLQHFVLQPGEALFLPANEPHAYLSGDCMECMANSDNVVRAGLTPKFKDVDVLTTMLTFDSGKEWTMRAEELEPGILLYKAPVEEFAVEFIEKSKSFELGVIGSCAICIVLDGRGTFGKIQVSKGSVIFIPGGSTPVTVEVEQKMMIYRAFVPSC